MILSSLAFLLFGSAAANDLSCPFNAKGQHPKCLCNDDNPYDEINRICATVLDAQYLLAKCPKGMITIFVFFAKCMVMLIKFSQKL